MEAFKLRMGQDHLQGFFSSREKKPPKPPVPIDEDALYNYLCNRWNEVPDALRVRQAGTDAQTLYKLIRKGNRNVNDVCGVSYFAKAQFMLYLVAPEQTMYPSLGQYKQIIREFKKRQCRMRENKKRREKRRDEKNQRR